MPKENKPITNVNIETFGVSNPLILISEIYCPYKRNETKLFDLYIIV